MADPDHSLESSSHELLVEMSRLKNLSDGVFAIALTLLVLDLRIPEGVLAGDLTTKLLDLAPKVLVYLISFVVIGGAWGAHQRMLGQIKRGDGFLVWLNLFSLLSVSIVPASAALLGRFPTAFVPIACFAINVVLIQLTAQWLWRHASRQGLTNPRLDVRVVASIGRRLNLGAIVFGLSIPLALLDTALSYLLWIGTFFLLFTTDWLSWQQAIKTRHASIPLEGARRAHIRVQHWSGQLNIGAHASTDDLLQGLFGGGLDSQISRSGEVVDVLLNIGKTHGFMNLKFPWTWGPANLFDWTLSLSQRIPIVLDVVSANAQTTLELGAVQIAELNITSTARSLLIELPAHAGQTSVNVQASIGSLVIRVPPEVGAQIRTARALTSAEINLIRFPMTEREGEHRSANYDVVANHIDIQLKVAAGSVAIV
jgi:uncharacterized membrane protein